MSFPYLHFDCMTFIFVPGGRDDFEVDIEHEHTAVDCRYPRTYLGDVACAVYRIDVRHFAVHVQRIDKLSQSCQHRFGRVVFDLIAGMRVGKGVYSVVAHTGSDYADHLLRVYACCCHELGKRFVHQVILQGHLVDIRLDFMVQVLLIVIDRVLVLV